MILKGPVTRIIYPLFLSLCLVLPLSKFRAAKTASLDVPSEARYSPRKLTPISCWSLIFRFSNFAPNGRRELIFGYVIVLCHVTLKLEKLRDWILETTAMSPRSLERSETNMRWVFCINFRGLYLASEDTSRDAVFAALIFEKGRTRQSDKNRGSIIRVTGPLTLFWLFGTKPNTPNTGSK